MIGAMLLSLVAGNLVGHFAEHRYFLRYSRPAPDLPLLTLTLAVAAGCFTALWWAASQPR
jgi:hypothetical protein